MRYLLDTNACIRYLNGRSERLKNQVASKRPQDIVLCSMVKAELFYGAMKSTRPEKSLAKVQRFADPFVSLPFDDRAAVACGRIRAHLETLGTPIGPNDLCIAAIALAHNVTLITHNTGEFGRVEGLIFEDWEV